MCILLLHLCVFPAILYQLNRLPLRPVLLVLEQVINTSQSHTCTKQEKQLKIVIRLSPLPETSALSSEVYPSYIRTPYFYRLTPAAQAERQRRPASLLANVPALVIRAIFYLVNLVDHKAPFPILHMAD